MVPTPPPAPQLRRRQQRQPRLLGVGRRRVQRYLVSRRHRSPRSACRMAGSARVVQPLGTWCWHTRTRAEAALRVVPLEAVEVQQQEARPEAGRQEAERPVPVRTVPVSRWVQQTCLVEA